MTRALLAVLAVLAGAVLAGCGGDGAEQAGAAGEAALSTDGEAGWSEAFPGFVRHPIDELASGYQAIMADVDGDGMRDVAALSTAESRVVWYRNPDWERFTVSTVERPINMAAHDVDGDGDLDLAVAAEFSLGNSTSGGTVQWAEAPDDPTSDAEWRLHRIDAVPTSHRLKWGDIDGDGASELLNLPIVGVGASGPEYEGAVEFKTYEIPSDPTDDWPAEILDESRLEVAHALAVVDWDDDGADDVLTASFGGVHLFRPALEDEDRRVVRIGAGKQAPRPDRGSSEVAPGRLGDEGRFVATIEPWHGNQVVVYRPDRAGGAGDPETSGEEAGAADEETIGEDASGARPPWSRKVVETGFDGGHALVTADFDDDGFDEIVAGYRGEGTSLFIYRYRPDTESWRRIPLDEGGMGTSSLDVGDLDGDGDLDVLAIGSSTDNVVWYENGGVP